jgi:uncharacterized protein (TIGR03086 family)
MDVIELHERALDQTGKIVDGVTSDELERPTPCTEWNVRALLKHLVGGNWWFADVANGTPAQAGAGSQDLLGGDLLCHLPPKSPSPVMRRPWIAW